ncbi:FAD-binding protein [Streptobacillus moniliformis]|uniref:FAD-dependent pyridine nucleotide-disulphide oxidoreductase n=1 Tax=Streptobacillus moniliformis (strain ATCC 14647 / DSM 12112 / NCTC 10651 / 9901) TaxID=519441 RepID=D1AY17_STRM9|nr:FAD-dependent oxidoreductase [Streptobacillus moniliformis]ACZ01193.1 FAD-dependent pyridine nucleotide-disulphide oxidoreductase [Streptobacillus moniliformis DSM 12112]AVL42449.1 FAD-binding protein [Streptobacillus moniliformis]SQA13655.1 Thioredoxin reductase [Streptobacillus moniliformis]
MEKKRERYDVLIIGGGSSGLTAGIYCGRAKLKTLVFEKTLVGGLATYTSDIANYPGFPDGIGGTELMNLFHKQAKNFDVKFKLTDVKSVKLDTEIKEVETFRVIYEAPVVIIAGGGYPRLTGALNEDLFLYDKGISFCATCDAAANTDKTVMVVGSGDSAIEEGIFLTKFAKKVIVSVVHDEGIMDCNEIAKAEALANPKMEFIWNSMVKEYKGNEKLETVILKNTKTGEEIPVDVDTCFLFIGYLPNTSLYKEILDLSTKGYIVTNEKMETNIEGVFAAGDIREKYLKQVSTAVGDGAIAGYNAEKFISETNTFNNQILNDGKETLVYLYDSSDIKMLDFLPKVEEHSKSINHELVKVDIYKSKFISNKLNIKEFPALVYLKDKKVVKIKYEL